MYVGEEIKIKKCYDIGLMDVIINKIYSDSKIECINPKTNGIVTIAKCDIVNKQYYINQYQMIQSICKQKKEYYNQGTIDSIKQDCNFNIFMI